ncbi:hypothetical protein predicted by Glimmer/Critica (plasmid) [Acetobacter senegalensis]|uniref:Uncharacterized protein n=1 Tax=Acetobacter senegalensis TaxID=446692 RepID=A0A0U5F3R2_9PROT|nr:hypothetical protein predicted by Glimmer/Critica [Acetobacter senegalensis]
MIRQRNPVSLTYDGLLDPPSPFRPEKNLTAQASVNNISAAWKKGTARHVVMTQARRSSVGNVTSQLIRMAAFSWFS